GCGEGYYLRRLAAHLQQAGTFGPVRLVGLDASKEAARLTASRLPGHPSAVVDIAQSLHLRSGCAAALLNVFAPRNPAAFADALMPGGLCLVVAPRTDHMRELRRFVPLLEIPRTKRDEVIAQFARHLMPARCEDLD